MMIPFSVDQMIPVLSHTPAAIRALLEGLDEEWLHAREAPDTWSPQEIVAHLIFGEQTDWIPRMQIILNEKEDKTFVPFDRNGHVALAAGRTMESLLHQFETLRKENLFILSSAHLTSGDMDKNGIHPAFGKVTLGLLLASWVVHDMTHLYQISRIMAKQYEVAVGPWKEYMGILNR
jgi:hypothetical protein